MLKDAPTRNGHAPGDGPAPRWRVTRTVRPARATRRLGRAPGTMAVVALLLLAAVGVKATLAPRATSTPPPRAPAAGVRDITEQGFAQAFARAYLSWDARRADQHSRQVAAFLSTALDGDGGLQMPPRGQQQVLWSAAIQDQPDAHGDRVITVAAQTTRELLYLAVPVHRTRRGFLVVWSDDHRSPGPECADFFLPFGVSASDVAGSGPPGSAARSSKACAGRAIAWVRSPASVELDARGR